MSSCTREVDTDEIKWVCKNQKCKVTFEIINNHINMLNNNELVQAIYISLTNSILDFYKDSE